MRKWQFGLTVVLAMSFSLAGVCFGQMGMHAPQMSGVWNPVVGNGAAYEMTTQSGDKHQMEITVVGKEKDAYWIEMGIQTGRSGQPMYMKMLMAPTQGNMVTQRVIMQIPGQANPMEVTSSMQGRSTAQASDFRSKSQRVGSETITVLAGTFVCEHWHSNDEGNDVWFTDKVTPWGVVKTTGKSNMVLVKVISDAKDHITGTPVNMGQMMRSPSQ